MNSIRGLLLSLSEGFKYVKNSKNLPTLLLIYFFIYFATGGIEVTVLYMLKDKFNLSDNIVSILFIFEGVGMLISSILSLKLNHLREVSYQYNYL